MGKVFIYFKKYAIAFRSGSGMWAYFLHKVTGVILVIYLIFHIYMIIFTAGNSDSFLEMLFPLFTPAVVLPMLAVILFHTMNGIRILLFDVGIGIRAQKIIFYILMLAGTVVFTLATFILYKNVF